MQQVLKRMTYQYHGIQDHIINNVSHLYSFQLSQNYPKLGQI